MKIVIKGGTYRPDACRSYTETGYCGFGDNCRWGHYNIEWDLENEDDMKMYIEDRIPRPSRPTITCINKKYL